MSNISNAAATGTAVVDFQATIHTSTLFCLSIGLYDPFGLEWAPWAFGLFGIPIHIMPDVVDDAGTHFGSVDKSIFGAEVAIRSVMADQSASVFGHGCFKQGQMKISLGSGSFLDVNTGRDIHASMKGLVSEK